MLNLHGKYLTPKRLGSIFQRLEKHIRNKNVIDENEIELLDLNRTTMLYTSCRSCDSNFDL